MDPLRVGSADARAVGMTAAVVLLLARAASPSSVAAQGIEPDAVGEDIPIAIAIPPDLDLGAAIHAQLESRLAQFVTGSGMAAVAGGSSLVLYPRLVVTNEQRTDGLLRNVEVVSADLSLFIKNASDGALFATVTRPVTGSGRTREAALLNAVSSLRGGDPELRAFVRDARARIVDHYVRNCESILAEGRAAAGTGDVPRGLAILLGVPGQAGACHERASAEAVRIFAAWQQDHCAEHVRRATAAAAANRFSDAVEELEAVDASSPCADDADRLIGNIEREVDERENAEIRVRLARYRETTTTVRGSLGSSAQVQSRKLELARVEAAAFFNRKSAREFPPDIFRDSRGSE